MTAYIELEKKSDVELGWYWSIYIKTATGGVLATSTDTFAEAWQFLIDEDFI